eukprot:RCo022111
MSEVLDQDVVAAIDALLKTAADLGKFTLPTLTKALEKKFRTSLRDKNRFIMKSVDKLLLSDRFADVSPAEEEEVLGSPTALKRTKSGRQLPRGKRPRAESFSGKQSPDAKKKSKKADDADGTGSKKKSTPLKKDDEDSDDSDLSSSSSTLSSSSSETSSSSSSSASPSKPTPSKQE